MAGGGLATRVVAGLLLALCVAGVASGMKLQTHSHLGVTTRLSTAVSSGGSRLWSELLRENVSTGHVVVPATETWYIDENMTVDTLTVRGELKWDTSRSGLVLRTAYLLVEEGGIFQLGSRAQPMEGEATIHITKMPKHSYSHPILGYRFLGSLGKDARIDICGRKLSRTWTLLSQTAKAGQKELFVKHSPTAMGWRVGDRIGLATTSRNRSTTHRIAAIGSATEMPITILSAEAGNEYPGEPATAAIDGSDGWPPWGSFCGGPECTGEEHWLVIRLDGQSYVTKMRINFHFSRYAPMYSVEVQSEGDPFWRKVVDVTDRGGNGFRDVLVGRNASAIRIKADYAAMDEAYQLSLRQPPYAGLWVYEVEVYGTPANVTLPTVLHLEEPIQEDHWGGYREIGGRRFEMAAEVVNLERSVVVTGDHDEFHTEEEGIHTIMSGRGIMDVRYTRVEYCGQRNQMGRYCLHFHHGGHCTDCVFEGNAIVDSQQVGITIHGTHRSRIENNIVWDGRGAGIYIEDGNEMLNTIRSNVVICSWFEVCAVHWLDKRDGGAGIYMIGMTNNLIENRIAGYENGIWTPGSAYQQGQGMARFGVCPQHTPFGTFKGNVNHDNQRFGLYLDNQMPRNLERSADGMVTNMQSCGEFTPTGEDNGIWPANVVQDEFDWHNMFVGAYALNDVMFINYTSINNAHGFYWKKSKNFADPDAHHFRNSVFANDASDRYGLLQMLGPAGPFTFKLKNLSFVGGPTPHDCAAICAGQHCGRTGAGGPCTVQYWMEDVDFSGLVEGGKRIKFGTPGSLDPGLVQPMFISREGDDSLLGHRSMVSAHLNGFARVEGCQQVGPEYDNAYGCNHTIRRLNLWSQDLGAIRIAGPGYEVEPILEQPVYGMNAGIMPYEPMHGGYGTPVIAGRSYNISGNWLGDVTAEFSDTFLPQHFGGAELLNVTLGENFCNMSATDPRGFLGAEGPAPGVNLEMRCYFGDGTSSVNGSGDDSPWNGGSEPPMRQGNCRADALVDCCPDGSCSETCSGRDSCCPGNSTCPSASVHHNARCATPKQFDCTVPLFSNECDFPNKPGIPYYWDPACVGTGGLGCWADGRNAECRFCEAGAFESLPCPPEPLPPLQSGHIINRFGICLQPDNAENGARVRMRSCRATTILQQWTYDPSTGLIRNSDGQCLDAPARDDNGGVLHMWDCWVDNLNQQWEYNEQTGRLKNRNGKCVDAANKQTDGGKVHMWSCFSHLESQQFSIAPPPQGEHVSGHLLNRNGICLDFEGNAAVMQPCLATKTGQQWTFDESSGQIMNLQGHCLDAEGTNNGALVLLSTCNETKRLQQWVYNEGASEIRNLYSGTCLDSPQRTLAGGKVHLWSCISGIANQAFHLGKLLPPVVGHVKVPDGICLGAMNGGSSNGDRVQMEACEPGDDEQSWTYNGITGHITNKYGLCLDAPSPRLNDGKVHMWQCYTGNENQIWSYNAETGVIQSRSGICLDAAQRKTPGGKVHMWQCYNNFSNQLWKIEVIQETTTTTTTYTAPPHCEFPNEPSIGYFWDTSCLPVGGNGCYADGMHAECRFCGAGDFPACPEMRNACNFDTEPVHAYFWDVTCKTSNGPGCWADSRSAQCRFCGAGSFPACPEPTMGIIRRLNGHCLSAASGQDGAQVTMQDCSARVGGLEWSYDSMKGQVKNGLGKCLDSPQATQNSGKVHAWSCHPNLNSQQWDYDATTGTLRNRHGNCLDSPQGTTEGGKVHMWSCIEGNQNQHWTRDPLPMAHVCSDLPNVQEVCSEDGCRVLVRGMSGRTCENYCADSSLACIGAWDDMDDSCDVRARISCDETLVETSDLICECGPQVAQRAPIAGSATPTTENAATPAMAQVAPGGAATRRRRRTAVPFGLLQPL